MRSSGGDDVEDRLLRSPVVPRRKWIVLRVQRQGRCKELKGGDGAADQAAPVD